MKWKLKNQLWVFIFQKYRKFWILCQNISSGISILLYWRVYKQEKRQWQNDYFLVGLGDMVSNQSNLAFDVVVASHHDKIILWPWLDITQLSSERLGLWFWPPWLWSYIILLLGKQNWVFIWYIIANTTVLSTTQKNHLNNVHF